MDFIEGTDYYINENGLYVFTAHYLLKRGYCCGNGCKHCPYETKSEAKQDDSEEQLTDNE